MDPQTRQQLEERVRHEVPILLQEGVQSYLQGLSREALMEVLENELRFLGLYAQSDPEAPALIHIILEEHLDAWHRTYLAPPAHDTGSLTHTYTSAASGIARLQETYYLGFQPPVDQLRIQKGRDRAEETTR